MHHIPLLHDESVADVAVVSSWFASEISQSEANANMLGVWYWTTPITISINLIVGQDLKVGFLLLTSLTVKDVLQGVTEALISGWFLTHLSYSWTKVVHSQVVTT